MGCGQSITSPPLNSDVKPRRNDEQKASDDEDRQHDLSVGARLGKSEVLHVRRSEIITQLLNTLSLGNDDQESLKLFVSKNTTQGQFEVSQQVWHPAHNATQPKNKRRLYVIWLRLDESSTIINVMKQLDQVLTYSKHMDELEDYGNVEQALAHFSVAFTPMHVLTVVDDFAHRTEIIDALAKMPSAFRFVVGDNTERRPSIGAAPEHDPSVNTTIVPSAPNTARKDGEQPQAEEAKQQSEPEKKKADLCILHFNDVYHIQPTRKSNPVGGADRFQTVLKQFKAKSNPLVLFSGDCFSPSIQSTVTKGSHMVPVLNEMGIHCAMYGNHDFDFGVDVAAELGDRMNFPWLLSNVLDGRTHGALSHSLPTKIIEWNGVKIGLMGLAEKEWIDTLPILPAEGLVYLDFIEEGRKFANQLKAEGVDVVIALTHMREPNDILLAQNVPEIDLVLGGHDHFYNITHVDSSGVTVIKSGSEFRELSYIELFFHKKDGTPSPVAPEHAFKGNRISTTVQELHVDDDIVPDDDMGKIVLELVGEINVSMEQPIGRVETVLDATFESARTRESNVGNFISDIIRRAYKTDVAIICGGCIRSDNSYGPGDFTLKDVLLIFPFEDPCVVLSLTGQMIWDTLENGVCSVPKMDGRFPQVSGMRFVYDPEREPNKRVVSVHIGNEPLDLTRTYSVATREYMAKGNDGFHALPLGTVMMDDEEGLLLSALLRNYFWAVEVVNRMHAKKRSRERIDASVKEFNLHLHHPDHHEPLLIAPAVEGRIMTVMQEAEELKNGGSVQISDLPKEINPEFAQLKTRPESEPPTPRSKREVIEAHIAPAS